MDHQDRHRSLAHCGCDPLDGLAAHVSHTPLEHGGPGCARRRTALVPATHARPTGLRVLVVPLTGHTRIMV